MKNVFISLVFILVPIVLFGQSETDESAMVAKYESLMGKARDAFKEKNYSESSIYYTELIYMLEANGHGEELVPKLKEMIAVNNNYIANAYNRNKEYDKAIELLTESMPLCIEGSKVYIQLNSSLATSCGMKSTMLKMEGEYESALEYCNKSEKHYGIAGKQEMVLRQRVSRSDILIKMGRTEEAQRILGEVIDASGDNISVQADALCSLAKVELSIEDFQNAIRHAEMAYQLSKEKERLQTSRSAWVLWRIYDSAIADSEKAAYWKNIYETNKE